MVGFAIGVLEGEPVEDESALDKSGVDSSAGLWCLEVFEALVLAEELLFVFVLDEGRGDEKDGNLKSIIPQNVFIYIFIVYHIIIFMNKSNFLMIRLD